MKVWQSRPQGSYPEKALIPWLLFLLPAPTPRSMWQLPVSHPPLLAGSVKCREGDGTPLQYSCLENPMDGGAWWAAVHGVEKSRTQLIDFTFTFHFTALEKEMATHSSVLAWRIPGTGEPGGLPSMGVTQSQTQLKRLSSSSSRLLTVYSPPRTQISFSLICQSDHVLP